jgi:hypothetical protein
MKVYGGVDVDMFLDLGTSCQVGQLYAPVALSLGKEPLVPIG